jgi:hypothetical protein
MQTLVDASIFLLGYLEPHKVLTNPRWCPYAKGSPRKDQAPQTGNSIESQESSPRASGAPLLAPLVCSPLSLLLSFQLKCHVPCPPSIHDGGHIKNSVGVVSQDFARSTRYKLLSARARGEDLCGFFNLTQSTRNKPRASAIKV